MSEEFSIQCPDCGTYYNDLQDVCPYCGEPQPVEDSSLPPEAYYIEPASDEEAIAGDSPEAYYQPGQELYPEDAYLPQEEYPAEPFFEDDIFAVAGEDAAPNPYLNPPPPHDYRHYSNNGNY